MFSLIYDDKRLIIVQVEKKIIVQLSKLKPLFM